MSPRPGVTPEDLPALRAAHADKANARLVERWKRAEHRLTELRRAVRALAREKFETFDAVTGGQLLDLAARFDGRRKGARK